MGQDFGQMFNYTVWNPETNIELCRVPWNSDYRDIVKFDTEADLLTFLNSTATSPIKFGKSTYARVGDPIKLNVPFNQVYQYNYLRVYNSAQPISGTYLDDAGNPQPYVDSPRNFYYFITDVRYLAPNTTEIQVQLDVWQTFGFDITFGNCYIERGHIGIANENAMDNEGRDFLTIPEGLDIGDEYVINNIYTTDVNAADATSLPHCWIMMGVGADITVDPGTVDAPILKMSGGSAVENLPQGCDIIFFKSPNDFEDTMAAFADMPWVTETIQFIMAIPPIKGTSGYIENVTPFGTTGVNAFRITGIFNSSYDTTIKTNWRTDAYNNVPTRYQSLDKFYTYPYTVVEMTTYSGQPLILKPELMPGPDIVVTTIQHTSPPSPRWAFVPKHYNATGTGGPDNDGEYLDFATYLTDFPQFTVLNNGYLAFMAANRNQIAYQYSSADWSQQRALQGNQVAYGQAQESISADQSNRYAAIAASLQTGANNIQNNAIKGGVGVGGALIGGNVEGALAAGMGIASDAYYSSQNLAIQAGLGQTQADNARNLMGYNRDTNKQYSDFAARGDYQNAINGVNARVRDAKLIQPTVNGQMGGESFLLWAQDGWNITTKIKQINPGMMAVIGEYWLRYGYAVNRFANMPSTLKCMDKFTYWKLKETYITSWKCPETFKQTIRGIFEKGVTIWSNPADIGTIDMATNTPLSGITL